MHFSEVLDDIQVTLFQVAVPLRQDHETAHGTEHFRRVILCRVADGFGHVGWGECPTLEANGYVTESTSQSWAYLTQGGLEEVLADSNLCSTGVHHGDQTAFLPAQGSVLDALYDLQLQHQHTPLSHAIADTISIGHTQRTKASVGPSQHVARTVVIAAVDSSVNDVLDRSRSALDSRAAMVKLKVDAQVGIDQVMVLTEYLDAKQIAVDANGSFDLSLASHRNMLTHLDGLGLAYIEQPISHSLTWSEQKALLQPVSTAVVFDESVQSLHDVEQAVQAHPRATISLKPARLGGIRSATQALAHIIHLQGSWLVGGMLELGVGRATALALASMPGSAFPTDLGPSAQYFNEDLTDALVVDPTGEVVVPQGPGCGRSPRPKMLESVTELRWDLP